MRSAPLRGRPSGAGRTSFALRALVIAATLFPWIGSGALAATLTGAVVDPDGRPVSGARVVARTTLGTVREVVTALDGRFTIADLASGRYDVRVIVDGLQADPESFALGADEHRDLPIRLRISAITESIVVSAGQVDVPRSTSPQGVTIVTAADLAARQIETVADALRTVPGLGVVRSGGRGALTSIFPRGGASNYTLVLVDGIRANAFGGGFDFAHLSTANIDRIEIVRGPQSALFGSEAIGAVVQIVTRRGGPSRVAGVVEGGGQGTSRVAADAAGSKGAWAWGVGTERVESDGFTGTTARGERVVNDDYRRLQATGTASYAAAHGSEVAFAGAVATDERGFPGPYGADPMGAFPGIDRISRGHDDTRRVGVKVVTPWSGSVRQRAEVSYADLAGEFTSPFGLSSSGTRRLDARLQEDVRLAPRLAASVGVELVRERGTSTFVTGADGDGVPIDRRALGTFVEARVVETDRFLVTGGARVEHLVRDAVPADPLAFAPRPFFPRQTVTSVNPKIAASVRVTPATANAVTRVRASAGTGIRPPDVFEIAFTDNPDLRPERSRSLDVGLEQQFAGGAVVVDVGAFSNRYDDLIVTVGRSLLAASRYRSDNISNARARGLEVSGRARLPHGFGVATEYTWLATAILSIDNLRGTAPAPFAVGDPLVRRPRHQGRVDVSRESPRVSAFATVHARGRTLDLEPNFGAFGGLFHAPGYLVVDAGVAVPVWRHVTLFGRVTNLTNRLYEETLGFPALGRTGVVGVRVASGR
jgi:outer membrane cobalamin receptor